ncbi:MAG: hypothetical protein WBP22_02750 [Candidatus Saccharimonas sp.]
MASVLQKAYQLLVGDDANVDWLKLPKKRTLKKFTERELLTLESEIGSKLFGPIPEGHRREFFCLDEKTWIWHEEWLDEKKKLETSTVRYEINEHGVLKVQEGARYSYLEGEELQNFGVAIRMYYEQVARGVYNRDPATGQKLV